MNAPEDESCPMNEQAIGFAVHGLEPDEEIEVLRHLPQCPSCRAVLADAQGVFTRLGGAVEQIDPPPSLRASLMGRVAQTPQISRAGPTTPASSAGFAPARPRQVEQPPTGSTPNGSTPVEPASGGSTPAEPTTPGSTPVEPTSGESAPVEPTAAGSTPAETASDGSASVEPTTAGSTPAEPTSGGSTPAEPAPDASTPVEPPSGGLTPTESSPGGLTPTESSSGGWTPAEPTPGGSTPAEPTSGRSARVESSPGASTPADPAPGGSAPVEPTSDEPAPSGSATEPDVSGPGPSTRSESRRRPPAAPPSRPADAGPASRGSRRSRRGRLVAAAVALVGVLAIGGLAVRTVQLQERLDAELAQDRSAGELVEQLARPGARYALLAPEGGPTAAAVVVADGERRVYPIALPPNATARDIYVLWGIDGTGTPQPLGTFDVLPADPGLREVGTDAAGDAFAQYAISIEPGRAAPTTPTTVVAIGEVVA